MKRAFSIRNFASFLFYHLYKIFRSEDQNTNNRKVFSGNTNDIYLVSYPRSGNTWVRVILAEIFFGESGKSLEDLQRYIPDIHVKTYSNEVIQRNCHIIKSHNIFRPFENTKYYRKVIYLLRDPRDIVLSYYRYRKYLSNYSFGLEEFIVDWLNGRIWPGSWREHVQAWTNSGLERYGVDLYLIKYEDLLEDAVGEIANALDYFNFKIDKEEIGRAVKLATVEHMVKKEKRGMRKAERAKGFSFIGPCVKGQWAQKMSNEQSGLILKEFGSLMKRYGYLL